MKRALLGFVLLACSAIFFGCGLIFVAHSHTYANRPAPSYCYNCHSLSAGVVYSRCNHYEILVTHGGYYYRPYRHGRHEQYVYVEFNTSDNHRDFRSDGSSGVDYNREKSKRGRR